MSFLASQHRPAAGAFVAGSIFLVAANVAGAHDAAYRFDDRLLLGSGLATGSIDRFNRQEQSEPGVYLVDVYINEQYAQRTEVDFQSVGGDIGPCVTESFIREVVGAAPLKGEGADGAGHCVDLQQRLAGSTATFDVANLRLDIWVPQALLDRKSRDQVSIDSWDSGQTMGFVNYDVNVSRSRVGGANSDYGAIGVNAGMNIGKWRMRHQSNYTYTSTHGRNSSDWNSIRSYAQRALPGIGSDVTIGNSNTEGNLFSSLGYRGIRLATDERMIPDSRRNYAPRVQGVAGSKSRVVISQNGLKLQEQVVPPGAFVIDDIYGAAYGGDLDVQVIAFDGGVTRFTVPFSAVPESVRPGYSRYSATLGEAIGFGEQRLPFAEVTYQRGISNRVTAHVGARVGENYAGLLAGGVVATPYGALGGNAVFSRLQEPGEATKQGYRIELNYSKTFQATDTTFTLAGYRYSSSGFREFSDVLGRASTDPYNSAGLAYQADQRNQRNQFNLVMNQRLGSHGALYLTGSAADYFNDGDRDVQFQFGYSNAWRRLSYSVSLSQQHACATQAQARAYRSAMSAEPGNCRAERSLGLTISMPLGAAPRAPMLSTVASRNSGSNNGSAFQSVVSGAFGEHRDTSYALSAGHAGGGGGTQWSGNIQTQTAVGGLSAGVSGGSGQRQATASMRGAVVLHDEGVTVGPYVGDTFALIKAEGAAGSSVRGGQGARVDRRGFALAPSLSPYRRNQVALDPQDISDDAELVETEKSVVPTAGAALRVDFKTRTGQPVIIRATRPDGTPVPMGAAVIDDSGVTIGMVGQAGLIYARSSSREGHLSVKWANGEGGSCGLPFDAGEPLAATAQPKVFETKCLDTEQHKVGTL